jgi:hypothetical protein
LEPLRIDHERVVSVGGNDALAEARILSERVRSVAEALLTLSSVREEFANAYRDLTR